MEIKTIRALYFSPTGGTEKVARAVAAGTGWPCREVDLCAPFDPPVLEEDEVLLAAVPVFGGRVPAAAAAALEKLLWSATATNTSSCFSFISHKSQSLLFR